MDDPDPPGTSPAAADTPDVSTGDTYDHPWKLALEAAFPSFMAFYFPEASAQIDWPAGHEFLKQELRQIVPESEVGPRVVDALVKVQRHDGTPHAVYVHVEIQGRREKAFAERMLVYHYRIYDRFRAPVASFGVLADLSPRCIQAATGGARGRA